MNVFNNAYNALFYTKGQIRSTNEMSALAIMIIRISLSLAVVICVVIYISMNIEYWSTAQLSMPLIIYGVASTSLVINVAHLRAMTSIYKFYSLVFVLAELTAAMLITFIFSVLMFWYFLTHPLKALAMAFNGVGLFFLFHTAIRFYLTIQSTPNGALATTLDR